MDHVGRDLAARALISNPLDNVKEARSRELISPVLMAAAILAGAGDIEMWVFWLHYVALVLCPCKHERHELP